MARPGSERATRRWLAERSALDELLGVDFQTLEPMQLYRASDALMAHREAIEHHLFDRAMDLFDLHPTVTLYDLTNTYFEGEAGGQPKARRGHSKEKRTDCPLLTLGLVLDASGFVRRSQVFAGNVREHHTLAEMLDALNAPRAALVVMDRGIATEDRVQWLREQGYRYLVVSRERTRRFDAEAAVRIETASSHGVHLHKVLSDDAQEVRLYCFSEERAAKERGIVERFAKRFEDALTKLSHGLSKPRTHKRLDKVWQRIGRLKAQSRGVAQHYDVELDTDKTGQRVPRPCVSLRRPVAGTMMTHPGVYCLRSNQTDWDEATLWRTYFTLTDLEAVFRSLKVRTRPTPDLSPQAHPRRRPSVHHRDRLSTRAGDSPAPARERRDCELDHALPEPGRPATHHRHLPTCRRAYAACAQSDPRRSTSAGDLRRPRRELGPRRHPQDHRVKDPLACSCSATRSIRTS